MFRKASSSVRYDSESFQWCVCVLILREPGKEAGRPGKAGPREKLWARSKEPLKQPLMKSLQKNSELSQLACNSFTDILPDRCSFPRPSTPTRFSTPEEIVKGFPRSLIYLKVACPLLGSWNIRVLGKKEKVHGNKEIRPGNKMHRDHKRHWEWTRMSAWEYIILPLTLLP